MIGFGPPISYFFALDKDPCEMIFKSTRSNLYEKSSLNKIMLYVEDDKNMKVKITSETLAFTLWKKNQNVRVASSRLCRNPS